MSRLVLALFAVVAAVALGLGWIALRPPAAPHVGADRADVEREPIPLPVDLVVPEEPLAATATDADHRISAAPPMSAESIPGDALWVEGVVAFPEGTPADERAFVIARGRRFAGAEVHRFEIAADGRFRAAFAPETVRGHLAVAGRYVHSAQPHAIDPRPPSSAVQLDAELGGCLRVRVRPSPMAASRGVDLGSARVSARASLYDRARWWSARAGVPDASGVVELGGLLAGERVAPALDLPGYASPSAELVVVEPGRVRDVTLDVIVAPHLRGVVRDSDGRPVARAVVHVASELEEERPIGGADDEGRFDLRAPIVGDVWLRATARGAFEGRSGPWAAVEGADRDGIVIEVDDGITLEGVVRWPDGAPAAGATVSIATPGAYGADALATAEADGRFRFGNLLERSRFVLTARARERGAAPDSDAPEWTARTTSAESGGKDVELVLGAGHTLRGRLVDDLGEPVAGGFVDAVPSEEDATLREGIETVESRADGAFELAGVPDGEWVVRAARPGQPPHFETVVLPDDRGDELVFVLDRSATIRGRLLDATRSPVDGASLSAATDRLWGTPLGARAVGGGRFALENLRPGDVEVRVTAPGYSTSTTTFELGPGETRDDVEIVLQPAARVAGRVLDAESRPWAHAQLVCESEAPGRQRRAATSDAAGEFAFEVDPGPVTVRVLAGGGAAVRPAPVKVTAIAGEVVRVEVGGPPPGKLRVRGVVRAGGPVSRARVMFDDRARSTDETSRRSTVTDELGRYETVLTGAGRFVAAAQLAEDVRAAQVLELVGSDAVVDLDFGRASVRGRVLGADGRPLEGVLVSIESERVEPLLAGTTLGYATTKSARDGTFAFEPLPASTYRLTADGSRAGIGQRATADAVIAPLVVARDARVEGLELRLEAGGAIVVRVSDPDGAPSDGADVRVVRAGRELLRARADAQGEARFRNVPAGDATIDASSGSAVAREPVAVVVASGRTANAAIALAPGGYVAVRAVDGEGADVALDGVEGVWLEDASGARWDGPADFDTAPGKARFGPLRPGAYTARALIGGVVASAQTDARVGETAKLTLGPPQ